MGFHCTIHAVYFWFLKASGIFVYCTCNVTLLCAVCNSLISVHSNNLQLTTCNQAQSSQCVVFVAKHSMLGLSLVHPF